MVLEKQAKKKQIAAANESEPGRLWALWNRSKRPSPGGQLASSTERQDNRPASEDVFSPKTRSKTMNDIPVCKPVRAFGSQFP